MFETTKASEPRTVTPASPPDVVLQDHFRACWHWRQQIFHSQFCSPY